MCERVRSERDQLLNEVGDNDDDDDNNTTQHSRNDTERGLERLTSK